MGSLFEHVILPVVSARATSASVCGEAVDINLTDTNGHTMRLGLWWVGKL